MGIPWQLVQVPRRKDNSMTFHATIRERCAMTLQSKFSARLTARSIWSTIGLLAASAAAYPECSAGGCYDVYVEELYPEASGGAWIKTSGNEALANCTVDSNVYLRLNQTEGFSQIYATLLAAQLSDKKVNIRIVEGSNPCRIGYVTLNRNYW
jgi:hypothetical protein